MVGRGEKFDKIGGEVIRGGRRELPNECCGLLKWFPGSGSYPPTPPTVLGVSDEHMWGDYSNFGFLHIAAECNISFNSLFSLYNFILSSYHSHTPPPLSCPSSSSSSTSSNCLPQWPL